MSGPHALQIKGLRKRCGDRDALTDVDLVVGAGEIHGLLGANGAGKTTLMRIVLGLARQDAGSVEVLGQEARRAAFLMPGGVAGFVDTPQFYPYLSARRNLALLARLDGAAPAKHAIDGVLERVSLADRADTRVEAYSSGMRQRLGLAAALLRRPRLLVLDEPSTSLDPLAARTLRAQLGQLASEGTAVLLSSHDMAELEELCTRLTILHRGRAVFSGSPEELRKRSPDAVRTIRTSDDAGARSVAREHPGVDVGVTDEAHGLELRGREDALDRYMIALGRAGIAVRSLELRDRTLPSIFLDLTSDAAPSYPERGVPEPSRAREATRLAHDVVSLRAVGTVVGVEWVKLAAHVRTWALFAACLLGPFGFAEAIKVQSTLPEDTLFGRGAAASGFALPLVVLGFAGSWAFPVICCVVGGDIFSAEDRYRTWPTLLLRSRTGSEIFVGKAVAATLFSLVAVTLLGMSSMAAGMLVQGTQPLLGLSGTLLAPAQAMTLIATAWASMAPPVVAFTAMALWVSVATRSSGAGVMIPVLVGFSMQLLSFVNGPDFVRRALLTTPLIGWHGLFAEPRYYRPLIEGAAVSGVYAVACLVLGFWAFRRRELAR